MSESEFQNIIAQQIIKCIGAKHTPCITWESALLLPTRHKRNITDSKQPETVSGRNLARWWKAGSGQLVTHPLLSLPPHCYFPTIQVPCQAVNHGGYNYAQETAKNGLKQETAMKPAISLHTTELIRGNEGQVVLYIPSDLSTSSPPSFIFNAWPFHAINCTHSSSGLGNFLFNVLLNIPYSKTVSPIWAYRCEFNRERGPQKSLIPTT